MTTPKIQKIKSGSGKQLICFPFLGGHAFSFLALANALQEDIEIWAINPPGHGASNEHLIENLDDLLALYYAAIQDIIQPNAIFFGHSMGGIVAYFLMQKIFFSNPQMVKPQQLILSACNPPSYFAYKKYSELSDIALMKHLQSFDDTLSDSDETHALFNYFSPSFRADFKILENAANFDYQPLSILTYFLWSPTDTVVPINAVTQWSKYFKNKICLVPIEDGGHMFVQNKSDLTARKIESIMSEV